MEKLFKLKENGTNVRIEIIAGLTTFLTMAYIIALNPNLLTRYDVGSPLWNGVFMATCLASGIGTIFMAIYANKPFAMAPGIGINAFFAAVVLDIAAITGMSYVESFQAAICIVLIEGMIFTIISLTGFRDKIIKAIPLGIKNGLAPAIGLMLMNFGFGSNVAVYDETGRSYHVLSDFFGTPSPTLLKENMGAGYPAMALSVVTIFIGLFIIVILAHRGIKCAVIIGILLSSVFHWAGEFFSLGINPFASLANASFIPPFADMASTTLFRFNFSGLLEVGWFMIITLIISFCMIDMFDSIGTLVGISSSAGMTDKDGNMPEMKQALTADAVATITGAATGTSTVTTYIESAAGVEAGGRTGLTSLTTGIMFLLCIFFAPVIEIIPSSATSSALIYVGILMLRELKNIDFSDMYQYLPVFIMLITMTISGSVGHAIGIALITDVIIKLFTGKKEDISELTFVLSIIFIVKFFLTI